MCVLAHLALGLAWVTTGGCEGVVAFFFSEFTIPVAQKASWLLVFGTGVLLVWPGDISMSACFYTVQDLLSRLVQTRCCLRSLTFLSEEVLHLVILRPASGRSWRMALGALSGYRPAPG